MAEQSKIAILLSLLDERIATQNKIIEKYESLINGIRDKTFSYLKKSTDSITTIGEVLQYEQPQDYLVSDTEYTYDGIPVLTANKAFVLGFTTENWGIYDKGNCIIFDDFTLDCKFVNFPFKVKSSAIKILTSNDNLVLRYTFEYLKYLCLSTDEHKRHYITEIQHLPMPLTDYHTIANISSLFDTLSMQVSIASKLKKMYEDQKCYLLHKMFI